MARASSPRHNVKTTVDLPEQIWRAAKIRAMDDRSDLRSVIIAALRTYLGVTEAGDAEPDSKRKRR
jgi:hypothetical protein